MSTNETKMAADNAVADQNTVITAKWSIKRRGRRSLQVLGVIRRLNLVNLALNTH